MLHFTLTITGETNEKPLPGENSIVKIICIYIINAAFFFFVFFLCEFPSSTCAAFATVAKEIYAYPN